MSNDNWQDRYTIMSVQLYFFKRRRALFTMFVSVVVFCLALAALMMMLVIHNYVMVCVNILLACLNAFYIVRSSKQYLANEKDKPSEEDMALMGGSEQDYQDP
jgi:hypothetical protein